MTDIVERLITDLHDDSLTRGVSARAEKIEAIERLRREISALQRDDAYLALKLNNDDLRQRAEAAEAELAHFKSSGTIEVAVRNSSVSEYMRHWEGRALTAEAERDALRAATALCEKHAPNGGARSVCVICSGMTLRADAERYRWLRENDWTQCGLCVVDQRSSEGAISLGIDCPSHNRLDAAIDAAMAAQTTDSEPVAPA